MMKRIVVFAAVAVALAAGLNSCNKIETPENIPSDKYAVETGNIYKVVSHRGGYKESGVPECSIEGLKYSAHLRCYAAECDIVATSDGKALIYHPVDGKVNGYVPYEHTLSEIRLAGRLANGEKIPTMEDYLDFLTDPELNPNRMKIWIDCKSYTADNYQHTIDAINNAYQVISDRNAFEFCEFMCPAGDDLFARFKETAVYKEGKCPCAWMSATSPSKFDKAWAQLRYDYIIQSHTASIAPTLTPETYLDAGMTLSIYCCTDSSDADFMNKVCPYYPRLKAMFTNYPARLIARLVKDGYEK